MPLPSILFSDLMLGAAVLYNDAAQTVVTNSVLLPYCKMALDELITEFQTNNLPITNKSQSDFFISAGTKSLSDLPNDLVEIQRLLERTSGSGQSFLEMKRLDFLPAIEVQTAFLQVWAWQNQEIKFIGANGDIEIRMEYIGSGGIQPEQITADTEFFILNANNFMKFRMAGLAAEFIGENKDRADSLNGIAGNEMEKLLIISTKGRQTEPVRRRPFMGQYKMRGRW